MGYLGWALLAIACAIVCFVQHWPYGPYFVIAGIVIFVVWLIKQAPKGDPPA